MLCTCSEAGGTKAGQEWDKSGTYFPHAGVDFSQFPCYSISGCSQIKYQTYFGGTQNENKIRKSHFDERVAVGTAGDRQCLCHISF